MRLFALVFISLATAISINALYLQEVPRLAGAALRETPLEHKQESEPEQATITAAVPKQPQSSEPALPDVASTSDAPDIAKPLITEFQAKPETQKPPIAAPDPVVVKGIERELFLRGYAVGPRDGDLDIQTRAAIIAYEFDKHLQLTGEAGEALLQSLIFGKAEARKPIGPAVRFEENAELVRQVQMMLAEQGYMSGPIDGILDSRTRKAIQRFEEDRSLSAEGRLTERVLLEMVIVTGRPFAIES